MEILGNAYVKLIPVHGVDGYVAVGTTALYPVVDYQGYGGIDITWNAYGDDTITDVNVMAIKEYNTSASYAASDTSYFQYLKANGNALNYILNVNATSGSVNIKGAKATTEDFYLRLAFYGDSRKCIHKTRPRTWSL